MHKESDNGHDPQWAVQRCGMIGKGRFPMLWQANRLIRMGFTALSISRSMGLGITVRNDREEHRMWMVVALLQRWINRMAASLFGSANLMHPGLRPNASSNTASRHRHLGKAHVSARQGGRVKSDHSRPPANKEKRASLAGSLERTIERCGPAARRIVQGTTRFVRIHG
jgi:hypothetical protein